MVRLRPLIGRSIALLLSLSAGVGCMSSEYSVRKMSTEVLQTTGLVKPTVASQVDCVWQRRLMSLPDPTRDGMQTPGLVGQMFLVAADNSPADVTGDLTVAVYDETPRPPVQPPHKPELWHFTKEVLKRLASKDQRFGPCLVLFIPWPAEWSDVATVKIAARYQPAGGTDLYAREVRIALDSSAAGAPLWNASGQRQVIDNRSVPDANRLLKEIKSGTYPTMPANFTAPQPPVVPAAKPSIPPQAYPPPTPIQSFPMPSPGTGPTSATGEHNPPNTPNTIPRGGG